MPKLALFSAKSYDKQQFLCFARQYQLTETDIIFIEAKLSPETAVLAQGCQAVCAFVNDDLSAKTLTVLNAQHTTLVLLRCAGFNQVDLGAAHAMGITIARVPAYSPYAVAEHALALMLTLNRRTHRAYNRVKEGNYSLDGLMGFDMHGKTVGIIGTGKIGEIMAGILKGLGCQLLAHDVTESKACLAMGVTYMPLTDLYKQSDIITLHCPLLPQTTHMINTEALALMKTGVMLINTSRGALIDADALIPAIKSGKLGFVGLDVYEEEGPLFFEDYSNTLIQDDTLMRLTSFPNVLVTSHQAFFTLEAVKNIVCTTLQNFTDFINLGRVKAENQVGKL
jgi:D-lactate dehydrogenase